VEKAHPTIVQQERRLDDVAICPLLLEKLDRFPRLYPKSFAYWVVTRLLSN